MTETGVASQRTGVSQTEVVALKNLLKWTMEELNLLQMQAQQSDHNELLDTSSYHMLGTLLWSEQTYSYVAASGLTPFNQPGGYTILSTVAQLAVGAAKLAPGLFYFAKANLVHPFFGNIQTQVILAHIIGLALLTKQTESVIANKDGLVRRLLYNVNQSRCIDRYHRRVALQSDDSQAAENRRFKLREIICTNGLVLNPLAINTSKPRPEKQAEQMAFGRDPDEMKSDHFNVDSQEEQLDDAYLSEDIFDKTKVELRAWGLGN
ncbi:hypothetical protein BGZ99_001783 [Dissophora globulifera]|uniref:Uncharacterized protein n=1 Tax=Dissophora globulifera TaxID=979702 RepID=A0A9P6QZT6_9FUNG|nr:hypothetical protein BGZ99_001783 [Dissophora globulifera]